MPMTVPDCKLRRVEEDTPFLPHDPTAGKAPREKFLAASGSRLRLRRLRPEHRLVVPADYQAGAAIRPGAHGVDGEAPGGRLGDVKGRLALRDGAGGHHEVDVLLGLDVELLH